MNLRCKNYKVITNSTLISNKTNLDNTMGAKKKNAKEKAVKETKLEGEDDQIIEKKPAAAKKKDKKKPTEKEPTIEPLQEPIPEIPKDVKKPEIDPDLATQSTKAAEEETAP